MKKNAEVLSERKIQQKMAGYKSAYSKKIKAAVNSKERMKLMKERDSFLEAKEEDIRHQNRKAIQVRAGKLSWETRRKNESVKSHKSAEKHTCKSCSSKSSSKTNCKKIRITVK